MKIYESYSGPKRFSWDEKEVRDWILNKIISKRVQWQQNTVNVCFFTYEPVFSVLSLSTTNERVALPYFTFFLLFIRKPKSYIWTFGRFGVTC